MKRPVLYGHKPDEKSTASVWTCRILNQVAVTDKRLFVVVSFVEREEVQTDAEVPRAGAHLVRWLHHSEAVPVQNMWLVR